MHNSKYYHESLLSNTVTGKKSHVPSLSELGNTEAPTAIYKSGDFIKDGEVETDINSGSNIKHHSTVSSSNNTDNDDVPLLPTLASRKKCHILPLLEQLQITDTSLALEKTEDFIVKSLVVTDPSLISCKNV